MSAIFLVCDKCEMTFHRLQFVTFRRVYAVKCDFLCVFVACHIDLITIFATKDEKMIPLWYCLNLSYNQCLTNLADSNNSLWIV